MTYCPQCGAQLAEAAKFCSGCGKALAAPVRKAWPFWVKWLLVTPALLIAALLALGYFAQMREADRQAREHMLAAAQSPIDANLVDGVDAMPVTSRGAYYLSQFALKMNSRDGLAPTPDAAGGSGVPDSGGPGLHKP